MKSFPETTSENTTVSGPETESATENWAQLYNEGRTGWDRGEASPVLDGWLAAPTEGLRRILVPGCGRGYEVVELAKRGFEVTALDLVDLPLESLRAALTAAGVSATVERGDIFEWQARQPFDAVYEQTCLCAIDPGLRRAYERRIGRWLRPSGRLFALFMQTGRTGGPPFDCPMGAMRDLFAEAGWAWPSMAPAEDPIRRIDHPTGLHELAMILRRRP